ncbi:unnamed protein product [Arabis nemorensis]|uniref:Uncharacterized protein n=1 Tax=Arabis nemorensis TaxID=586526 RepID=A0A565BJA9_9BRAS|nr:unnamed protein product [Arabis nemorensis]
MELGHSPRSHYVKSTGHVSKLTKEDNVRMLHAELRKKKKDANIGKACLAEKYKTAKLLSTRSNWLTPLKRRITLRRIMFWMKLSGATLLLNRDH